MRLKNNSWVFDGALNKGMCEELIKIGNAEITKEATVDGGKKPAKKTISSSADKEESTTVPRH